MCVTNGSGSLCPRCCRDPFCQKSLHHGDDSTALRCLEPTFLAFLRNLTFWLFSLMVSFLVTTGRENGVGELSLPSAGPSSSACPTHCPLQSSLWVSLPGHLPRGQAQRDASLPCVPALPTPGHTPLVASAPSACLQTQLLKQVSPGAACLCCGVLEATVLHAPGPQASCPRVPPSSMVFSLSRNLELVHLIPAQYLAG